MSYVLLVVVYNQILGSCELLGAAGLQGWMPNEVLEGIAKIGGSDSTECIDGLA